MRDAAVQSEAYRTILEQVDASLALSVNPRETDDHSLRLFFGHKLPGPQTPPLYEPPSRAEELCRNLLGESGLVCFTGPCGWGKSTFLAYFKTRLWANPAYRCLVLSARDLVPTGQPLPHPHELSNYAKHAVRDRIQQTELLTPEMRRRFVHWICQREGLRLDGVSKGRQAHEQEAESLQEDQTPRVVRQAAETYLRQRKRKAALSITLVELLTNPPDALLDAVQERVFPDQAAAIPTPSSLMLRFLCAELRLKRFYLVFDNVDEIDHHHQRALVGVLNHICDEAGASVCGIISVRLENAHAMCSTIRYQGNRTTAKIHYLDPWHLDRVAEQKADVLLLEGSGRDGLSGRPARALGNAAPGDVRLYRVILAKRFNHAAASLDAKSYPDGEYRVALDHIRELNRLLYQAYLGDQLEGIVNHNMRDLLRVHVELLSFIVDRPRLLDRILRAQGDEAKVAQIATALYVWLHRGRRRSGSSLAAIRMPNLVESLRKKKEGDMPCFEEFMILALLDNHRIEQGKSHFEHYDFMSFKRLANALASIGFHDGEALRRSVAWLYSDGITHGHLIELITMDGMGWEPHRMVQDQDRLWVTPRGTLAVTRIPYKFFSILEGHLALQGRWDALDIPPGAGERQVLDVVRELMTHYLHGLVVVQAAHEIQQMPGNWFYWYRDRYAPRPAETVPLLQMELVLHNVKEFLQNRGSARRTEIERLEAFWRVACLTPDKARVPPA